MKRSSKKMIWVNKMPKKYEKGEWKYDIEKIEVIVMTIIEGYAMVRRKGCMPFVVLANKLEKIDAATS